MLEKVPGSNPTELLDRSRLVTVWIKHDAKAVGRGVEAKGRDGLNTTIWFNNEAEANYAFAWMLDERWKMKDLFGDLRGYLREHRDLLFTVALVMLVDHIAFEGAFKERVKGLIEGLLAKVEKPTTINTPTIGS